MPSTTNKSRPQKGLCLAEVLVSCLIAIAGIVAVLSSFLSGQLASSGAKHWTQADNLARARIEYLKSITYSELSALPGVAVESNIPLDDRGGGTGIQCTRMTSLTQEDDGISITVLVSWNEKTAGGFTPWSFQLRTWVAFPGRPGMAGG